MTFIDRRINGSAAAHRTFGSIITPMVTPLYHNGEPDTNGASTLAKWLTRTSWNDELLPIYQGMFRAPAAPSVKAAFSCQGLPGGPVRLPLVGLTDEETELLMRDVASATVPSSQRA